MTNKEKISSLSLCLGICMGFISKHNLFDEFKSEHDYVLETVDRVLYGRERIIEKKTPGNRKNGGYAAAAKLNSEERKARAKKAADTRWGNNE